jgi:glycosyltransferase involved in cell wall biosynthesis
MKYLYFIDFRGNLNPENSDVMKRHRRYGTALNSGLKFINESGKIVALGRYEEGHSYASDEFQVVNLGKRTRALSYFWQARRIISSSRHSSVALVAGDPWISTFIALAIKVFTKKPMKIETQIHFEFVGLFSSKGFLVRSVVKPLTLKILTFVQQIRVVDKTTLDYLEKLLGKRGIVYMAPSILNIDSGYLCQDKDKTLETRLLFVGRLHLERNPLDFIKILRILETAEYPYVAKVVGDGPMRGILEDASYDLILAGKIEFTGHLDQVDLYSEYCSADILVSTASIESYGRVLREAVFFGARILSSDTVGFRALKEELGSAFSETINGIETTEQLISKIDKLKKVQIGIPIRQEIETKENTVLEILGDKWTLLLDS